MKKTKLMLKAEEKIREPIESYFKRMDKTATSLRSMANELGVSYSCVWFWMKTFGITLLKKEYPKPTREELDHLYNVSGLSTTKIANRLGVSNVTVSYWMKDYNLERRSPSENQLPNGFVKPPKVDLERLYQDKGSLLNVAKELGVSTVTVWKWMNKYGIDRRRFLNKQTFLDLVKKDKTARDLVTASVALGDDGIDLEGMIVDLYKDRFKDRAQLRALIEENKEEVYGVIREGLTNLGYYIGDYTLQERRIRPVLMGYIIDILPKDVLTPSKEEQVFGLLKKVHGPFFNDSPTAALEQIAGEVAKSDDKKRRLYQRLYEHYQAVIALGRDLTS